MLGLKSFYRLIKWVSILLLVIVDTSCRISIPPPEVCPDAAARYQNKNQSASEGSVDLLTWNIHPSVKGRTIYEVINYVTIQGHYLYLTIGPKIVVFDIANAPVLTQIGQITLPVNGVISNFQIVNNQAYFFLNQRLWIVNFSEPSEPRIVSSSHMPWVYRGLVVDQAHAYIPTSQCVTPCPYCDSVCGGGIHILDVSDAKAPSYSNCYEAFGRFADIEVSQNYLYATPNRFPGYGEQVRNMVVLEILDDMSLTEVNTLDEMYNGTFKIINNYAYFKSGFEFIILDVSNPKQPKPLEHPKLSGWTLKIEDDFAYISIGDGLKIVDISDPLKPIEISHFQTDNYLNSFAVSGEYIYIVEKSQYNSDLREQENNSLRILDISNPTMIIEVGVYVNDRYLK